MATLVLSAAGMALGAQFGGSVLGLSGAVIGRAAGAVLGRVIDQSLLGAGGRAVETGRIDRLYLSGAGEGAALALGWGRIRVAGQVIWASEVEEIRHTTRSGGGKGGGGGVSVTGHGYRLSLALALCEGRIRSLGRIWADGAELDPGSLVLRLYPGSEDQLPDPLIAAAEGVADGAPAFRGTAYVVIEDLDLAPFGNRVPQLSFEVIRAAQVEEAAAGDAAPVPDMAGGIAGVALIPGTGEYGLATTPVHFDLGSGESESANVHAPGGGTDFQRSLAQLEAELPGCGSVALVVSWFGDDLRLGEARVRPKVEQRLRDGVGMAWQVAGLDRAAADQVALSGGRPVYGGTPCDAAVIEAIAAIAASGRTVLFYPFLLLEILAGNLLPDPWRGGAEGQAALPWRGRMTLSLAPGQEGSPAGTAAAEAEVAAFFGTARAADFTVTGGRVVYAGPEEWSYRRFILHCAALCLAAGGAAGGVAGFCIGSEMRAMTQVRGADGSFPAVAALRALAAEVRLLLGAEVRIGYAADWSEYAGFSPGNGDRYFHLDPLWADGNIDFIGIDNYMPLSDWREGEEHADAKAGWSRIHDLDYLRANVAGGEYYDWYYASEAHRALQIRTPITDGAHDEAWIWRQKDLLSWWSKPHHERIGGLRQEEPTAWVPRSKPLWFTEYGCAALDKGANQPNRFLDPKSSESGLPHFSDGRRDDLMQMQYLRAMQSFWTDPANNPVSDLYDGRMVDWSHCHVWAWDARPWPAFPALTGLWADGGNWSHGHWITGRTGAQPLENVVAEICARSGLDMPDLTGLCGLVRGYGPLENGSGRAALQPLMLAHGMEAREVAGRLCFALRDARVDLVIAPGEVALGETPEEPLERIRGAAAELPGRVRLSYVAEGGAYEARLAEAQAADASGIPDDGLSESELPLVLTAGEAQAVAERWLGEVRVGRDMLRLALPMSRLTLAPGDVLQLGAEAPRERYRIDRITTTDQLLLEAVRVEPVVYLPSEEAEEAVEASPFVPPLPVLPLFLDLPLMRGDEVAHAPHLAVAAKPWPGAVAVWSSARDGDYALSGEWRQRAVLGRSETVMAAAQSGRWDRGPDLLVRLVSGAQSGGLVSADTEAVLNGGNLFAIGPASDPGGDPGGDRRWELFQAAQAELVGPDLYALRMRLRGQAGSEPEMAPEWPVGSFVLQMDQAVTQLDLSLSDLGRERHFRIGPAARDYADASYRHEVVSFGGRGLRPLSPVHLRWQADGTGGGRLSWIRRTRLAGDGWEREVPLGEVRELYLLRISRGGVILREIEVVQGQWDYGAALRQADGTTAGFVAEVAQISELYGPGAYERIGIDG